MKKRWTETATVKSFGRLALLAVAIGLLVLVFVWLSGAFEEKIDPGQDTVAVRKLANEATDEVHEVTKEYIEQAIGTLRAASRTEVSSKILATIASLRVTAGDQVQKGDVLVELASEELGSRLKQAEETLTASVATREEAEQSFQRAESLMKEKAASQAEYDRALRSLRVAQADESRARQAVAEARIMLSYTTLQAPKAGRIVDRLAEPGDMARPGEPLLVLYDASSLRLEAPVLEQLAVNLRVGQTLKVFVDAVNKEYEATIDEIVPQADAPSRSFLVKASLLRSEDLYEGMFGRLRIPAGARRHLCLAEDAIHRVGQLEFVEVVRPDGSLERRYIKTGRVGVPGRVEVLSGLEVGERVVLHGGGTT